MATAAFKTRTVMAAAFGISFLLTACTDDSSHQPAPASSRVSVAPTLTSTPPSTSATSTSLSTTSSPISTTSSTETSEPAAETSATSKSDGRTELRDKHVQKTRDRFRTLAPDSLFAQFDSCVPNGVGESMACSGVDVGQFQFFASDAKAASTTQILTGLRNSRVIKDTGRFVVGWSTVGNTAIITVVDNDEGLVLQQMVSTDEVDPTQRIYDLGLAEAEAEKEPTAQSAETSTH
ncbi:MAG: hypothetical protein Q4A31_04795 [Corynebacterium sp.]|uniref:hypothetical protein n=1 Tax=Corynebacterium sp. TaxID=1720 RepID=UPI0026DCD217|nr:hypothetical protein [Corynebacterium sp.]MDO4761214.1 hypothetical protein [Corynebacterium sp.]